MWADRGSTMFDSSSGLGRPSKFANLLHSDPNLSSTSTSAASAAASNPNLDDDFPNRNSSASATASPGNGYYSGDSSPYNMSPWNVGSPFIKSPWSHSTPLMNPFSDDSFTSTTTPNPHIPNSSSASSAPPTGLIGSLVREEGHIYSLAASGDLLYTGSDSKNIRVWRHQKEYSGFKSNSGLVKAIVISGERIFTGHQDGKIRVWRISSKNPSVHKRSGTLPKFKDFLKSSIKPSNYVEVRRNRNHLWIKHFDAISCLSLSEDQGLLYSGSWDKTLKVWRLADSKCLESVNAHDDAVNSVVAGFDGLVFTGSADGTVKVWRREQQGKKGTTRHAHVQTLLKQECAVTALSVNPTASVVYCGSSDGLVNFWEREKQLSHGGVLRGHKLAVLCLAARGALVFSGSADKTICVWRREGGAHACLSVLTGHTGPVKCLAVEGDGEEAEAEAEDPRWIVYSGSLDKSVKVWRVSEQAPTNSMIMDDHRGGGGVVEAVYDEYASPGRGGHKSRR
ncbi:hypothetical protein QJS10_CPA05g01555 [Acorus calamus]|uniref:Uncharacterized protein n=1 Tax=Acorus calamus TaxID=4465 RepID=A0AAV9EQ68_ACOCL|nr:hypothetical protein QJS10_CPA05g01555 [Acorus calamus]